MSSAKHFICCTADSQYYFAARSIYSDSNNRWFIDNYPLALYTYKRRGGP
jgi:hypothetical protein